jgi:excinuclease ABC subunit C
MAKIREATDEQVLAVEGVSKRHLKALRRVIPGPVASASTGELEAKPLSDPS